MIKIPEDKKLHFEAGLGLSIILGLLFTPLFGLQIGIAAGIGKELYDWYDYGTFDTLDMIATWIGASVGAALTFTIHFIWEWEEVD